MMILVTITLTLSLNNVIQLINFLSYLFVISFELLVYNIEITLLILLIYVGALLVLFLVNGILSMSCLSFINTTDAYILYLFQSISTIGANASLFLCFPSSLSLFITFFNGVWILTIQFNDSI